MHYLFLFYFKWSIQFFNSFTKIRWNKSGIFFCSVISYWAANSHSCLSWSGHSQSLYQCLDTTVTLDRFGGGCAKDCCISYWLCFHIYLYFHLTDFWPYVFVITCAHFWIKQTSMLHGNVLIFCYILLEFFVWWQFCCDKRKRFTLANMGVRENPTWTCNLIL